MVYSVLEEPVIPVLMKDGARTAVGIRDAFLLAHDIRDIQEITPLERYAILRLLIAFAMDMLHPEDKYERRNLWDQKKFDAAAFDRYIEQCEKDGSRFDLFDSTHPFLQSQYDEELDRKKSNARKSVATLFQTLPSGNNHIFFDHRLENTQAVSFAEAFRALCACYLFCISNKSGPGSINNTPPLYAVIVGNNLFETLIINMLSEAEAKPVSYGIGTVPWRNGKKVIPYEEVADVTLLQALTWMPRRITLLSESNQTVQEVYFQPGLKFKGNNKWQDPHVPYRRKKDDGLHTIRPKFGRAVWRDVGSLLCDHEDGNVRPPQILRCLDNLLEEDEKPTWIPIRTSGLIVSGGLVAKYEDWCEEELRLPAVLLYDYDLANQFRADIETVETIQKILYNGVKKYVDKPRPESEEKQQQYEIAWQCQQYFLNRAHNLLFGECLDEICGKLSEEEHADHFCDAVKRLLKDTISDVMRGTGNSKKSLNQQMIAEKWIWKGFKSAVKKRKEGHA